MTVEFKYSATLCSDLDMIKNFVDEIDYFDLNFIGFSFDNLISIYNIKTDKGFIEEHKLTQNILSLIH